ncbi:hypothetical protein HDZ31DRAFT_65670 [Schizophyllum fasciatum]
MNVRWVFVHAWYSRRGLQCLFAVRYARIEPSDGAPVGIPQNAPLSPILSTIYTLPVLTCLDDANHPGTDGKSYVVDGILPAFACELDININKLSNAFATVVQRLRELGLDVDADKLELIHFTNRQQQDPHTLPHIHHHLPELPSSQSAPRAGIASLLLDNCCLDIDRR